MRSLQSPTSFCGDSAPARGNPPAPGPVTSSSTPDARTGNSAFKDAWGLTDHQRPVPTNLSSGGPQVLISTWLRRHFEKGVTAARPLLTTLAAWVADRVVGVFVLQARFAGPLTAPTTAATAPVASVGPDPQQPARPCSATATCAAGSLGGPDNRFFPMAWDCLLEDRPEHCCTNRDGQPVRAGQSCFASAQLMARRDFPTAHPELHAKAVELRIITAEAVV